MPLTLTQVGADTYAGTTFPHTLSVSVPALAAGDILVVADYSPWTGSGDASDSLGNTYTRNALTARQFSSGSAAFTVSRPLVDFGIPTGASLVVYVVGGAESLLTAPDTTHIVQLAAGHYTQTHTTIGFVSYLTQEDLAVARWQNVTTDRDILLLAYLAINGDDHYTEEPYTETTAELTLDYEYTAVGEPDPVDPSSFTQRGYLVQTVWQGILAPGAAAQEALRWTIGTPDLQGGANMVGVPRNNLLAFVGFPAPVDAPKEGVDLVEAGNGFLFRASLDRDTGAIQVERSTDAGATWEEPVLVGIDGDYLDDTPSAPALLVDGQDTLHCWYHNSVGDALGYYSEDYGETWFLFKTIPSKLYPRPALAPDTYLLAYFSAGLLTLASAPDWDTFIPTGITFDDEPPVQRVCLCMDAHGIWHLVYQTTTGSILHRWAYDPTEMDDWSTATTLKVAHGTPGYGLDPLIGLLTSYAGTAMGVNLLPADGDTTGDNRTDIPGAWDQAVSPAALSSQRNDWYFLSKLTDGSLSLQSSPDLGDTWAAPV